MKKLVFVMAGQSPDNDTSRRAALAMYESVLPPAARAAFDYAVITLDDGNGEVVTRELLHRIDPVSALLGSGLVLCRWGEPLPKAVDALRLDVHLSRAWPWIVL